MTRAFITGLAGTELTAREGDFLRAAKPCGLIVFTRNATDPDQLKRLIGDARDAIGADDVLVLVDQEGGRVQRLGPPHWRTLPAAETLGLRWSQDPAAGETAARMIAHLTAHELRAVGINTNCVPCADLRVPGAHDIIGGRAFGSEVETVVQLARIVAEAHSAAGVLPVVKHMPGHGRAGVDSHLALPVVDATEAELKTTDFAPFRRLADLPAAMTAHVVYSDIDAVQPATTSPKVMRDIVRGSIGFGGLLMSDDLSMRALQGGLHDRARAAIAAGCDVVLHCNGDLAEMQAVAGAVPTLSGEALARLERCTAITNAADFPLDLAAAEAALVELLALNL